ncbi:MAG: hypothetical protein AAGC60_01745 [Acidobacteriota bacterium]
MANAITIAGGSNFEIDFGTTSGPRQDAVQSLQDSKTGILEEIAAIDFANDPEAMAKLFAYEVQMNAADKIEQTIFKAEEQDQRRYEQVINGISTR